MEEALLNTNGTSAELMEKHVGKHHSHGRFLLFVTSLVSTRIQVFVESAVSFSETAWWL